MGALWIVALCASTAVAQEEQPEQPPAQVSPEDPEAARSAREHFEAGVGHFREHRYRDAIREFEMAAQLIPSADLSFNIARSHEELDEYEPAIEHYRRYLRDRVDPPDRTQVEQHIGALQERLEARRRAERDQPTTGTLRVRSNRDGAGIAIDREQIGEAPIALPLSLEPGRHRFDVEHDGYVPFRSEVRLSAGVTTAAYADLVPETQYRAIRGTPVWTWVVGGLAAGTLIASLGVGITALRMQNDDDLEDARDRAAISDYLLGGGLGLAVAAIVVYFIERRSVGTERIGPPDEEAPAADLRASAAEGDQPPATSAGQ